MEIAITVLVAVLGSAGLFGFLQFMISRHDTKGHTLVQMKEKLDTIDHKCDRNELATTRLQLIFLINSQPENKDTILATAQRYFVELDGNGEAWTVFNEWAHKNKLDIGWYKALLKRKGDKK